jgi:hypothetical protein
MLSESDLPIGRKKLDPRVRSISWSVTAEPRTGVAHNVKVEVMNTAQVVSGIRKNVNPGARILTMVVM